MIENNGNIEIEKFQKNIEKRYGKKILNILNGQMMYNYFKENNLMKDHEYAPFNEAMCIGDYGEYIFSEEFIEYRCNTHKVTMNNYSEVVLKPLEGLLKNKYDCIVLWFGEDMFCQINLLTILAYLDEIKYSGKVIFQLIIEETMEIKESYIEVNLEGYKEIYKQVMIHKQIPSDVPLFIMNDGIKLYFEYIKEENEITEYIKKNIRLTEENLIGELLRIFNKYGLGDIQYMNLINKCKK